jgi:hypothetical protein
MKQNIFIFLWILSLSINVRADLRYKTYRFSHERNGSLQFHDYNHDGLADVIMVSGRKLNFYNQNPNNHFSNIPDRVLDLPFPYSYYDFRNEGDEEEISLLSPAGIDSIQFTGDGFTTPPKKTILKRSLRVYPENSEVHFSDFFQDLDGDGTDDLFLPEDNFLCVYFADNLTSPVLMIPQEERFNFFRYEKYDIISPHHIRFGMWRYQGIGWCTIEKPGKPGETKIITQKQTYILSTEKKFITKENLESDSNDEDRDFEIDEDTFHYDHIDFNRDDKRDRVEIETKEGSFAPKTIVRIYLRGEDGHLSKKADQIITAGAVIPSWRKSPFDDVDGDGDQDLILLNLNFHGASLESNLKVFLKKGLSGELDFYLWNDESGYPKYPSFSLPIQLKWEIFNYFTPTEDYFYTGQDFTGDGKPDILVKTGAGEFTLHPFINEKEGFHKKALYVFQIPGKCEKFNLLNLNHDGVPDLHFICRDDSDDKISLDIIYISDF